MDTALVVKVKSAMQVYKGQGEGETKWKGWPWKLLLVSWDITNKKYFFLIYLMAKAKIEWIQYIIDIFL